MLKQTLAAAVAAATLMPQLATAAGVGPCTVPDGVMLSERDLARIENFSWSRLRGLASALRSQDAEARAYTSELYSEGLAPIEEIPPGDYRCRTIKLGGLVEAVVYGFFNCTVAEAPGGYEITKSSGSQRFSGSLTPAGDGLIYVGALNFDDEGAIAYRGDSDRDQVGCLFARSEGEQRYLLELPVPMFESFHDVIELVPAG